MGEDRKPIALVTGASRGIGRAIAVSLARAGFDVAGGATAPSPALTHTEASVVEAGSRFLPLTGDLADLDRHEAMVDSVLEHYGRIDLLVNNAGTAPEVRADILETAPASFDRVWQVNTRGTFFLTQRIARQMLRQENDPPAAIIFISSISAVTSSPSRAEYCLSKAAVSHMAHLFADRLAEAGVNVYDVRPGIIRTDMTGPAAETYDALIAGGLIPQGRWGEPEDIARGVVALARGDFGYATGGVIELSGGMNIRRL